MLESFIMAQKFSVRRALRRGFQPYLTSNKDYTELLLHALRQLANDAQTYFQMRSRQMPEQVTTRRAQGGHGGAEGASGGVAAVV